MHTATEPEGIYLCWFEGLDSDSSNDVDHIKKRSSNDPV